jgi:hypothetical protein
MSALIELSSTDLDCAGAVNIVVPCIAPQSVQSNESTGCVQTDYTVAEFDRNTLVFTFACPHCEFYTMVGVNEVACSIFRHGSYFVRTPQGNVFQTEQINPHTPKNICDQLVAEGKIIGCGKPLKMVRRGEVFVVEKCDYI